MDTIIKDRVQNGQRAYTRADQRFVREAVTGRRNDAVRFLAYGLWMIQAGMDAGADRAFLIDTAKGLHDAITNLAGSMRRDLDDAYLPTEGAEIDLTELDQFITTLER